MEERTPEVTVAVVVKDRRELMAACLQGILAQDHPAFEVVVVDNGSTDGTLELLQDTPGVRVFQHLGSLGAIRNAAVAAARAPVVAFVDSDCVPEPGWLAAVVAPFADERVGVVQGRTLPTEGAERGRWSATQELTSLTGRYEACNLAYRTDALLQAGGFDEAVGFFGEDTAAGWAVLRDGWSPVYAEDAVVRHVVTHPGLGWHLRRALGYSNINFLVRRFPELRQELLWGRWFLRPRSAAFALAAGSVLGLRWRPLLLLALPYAWLRAPRHRGDVVDAAGAAAFDAAVFAGLVKGSIKHRSVVL